MKKIVLIATVLLSSITLNAQEKQNDATWEETTRFIKKHLDKIDKYVIAPFFDNDTPSLKVEITDNGYLHMVRNDDEHRHNVKFDLGFLSEVRFRDGNKVGLYFSKTKEFIKYFKGRNDWEKRIINENSIDLIYKYDSELNPRVAKAWKHLAYLATKKREEARKASGDKF